MISGRSLAGAPMILPTTLPPAKPYHPALHSIPIPPPRTVNTKRQHGLDGNVPERVNPQNLHEILLLRVLQHVRARDPGVREEDIEAAFLFDGSVAER